jgi:hypothetical protein
MPPVLQCGGRRGEQLQLNGFAWHAEEFERPRPPEMPEAGPLSVNDVLRWPGMFGDQTIDFAAFGPQFWRWPARRLTISPQRVAAKVKNWPK